MAHISHVLARLKKDPIADLPIAGPFVQLLRDCDHEWRDRLLTPLVTLRLFLIQILNGNCAITALRQLGGLDFAKSSYSDARGRLPLMALQSLLQLLHERAARSLDVVLTIGHRIFIIDGSSFSTEDTPELREYYDLPKGTKPGVGYPMGKLMGLLDAATGMFVSLLALPLFQHDMRAVIGVHPMLGAGDILLGDRAFCSFAHLAMLQMRGVFVCVKLHQRRKNTKNIAERWAKPREVPAWMAPAAFASLPESLSVRIIRHTIVARGYRTQHMMIVTTLMDQKLWPDAKIAELYGQRWNIETCFDHLKTTMKMNALKCKAVEGVKKELAIYLAIYNLIRLVMIKAAKGLGVSPWRVSFVDAMRWLAARMIGLNGVGRLIVNPDRRGRQQLRVIRRRLKAYYLLSRPRREFEAKNAANHGRKP